MTRTATTFENLNPSTGECITEIECATREEVHAAVARARAAQREWARTPLEERIATVRKVAEILYADAEAMADTVTKEMGKPRAHALGEAQSVRKIFEYYGEKMPEYFAPQDIAEGERLSRLVREPIGVIGAITPWNFPVGIPLWTLVPALMAGNGIVFKPSEIVPLTGERIHRAFAAHLPEDLIPLCQGADETGKALVDSDVDMIAFVGSRAVGKAIMEASASRVRPLALELGGKDPLLILDDADLDKAAQMAVWGSVSNCGQVCCSVERIYVDQKIAPELESRIKSVLEQVKVGDGFEKETNVGPMASREQRDHVLSQVDDAVKRGARLEAGGSAIDGGGNFIQPTLLADLDESMAVMTEETFGPVIALRPVKDAEEAIRLANDTRYGLGASVLSGDQERALEVASRLEAGTVGVNRGSGTSLVCPWGGVKESGLGRMLGTSAIEEFTQTKVLHLK